MRDFFQNESRGLAYFLSNENEAGHVQNVIVRTCKKHASQQCFIRSIALGRKIFHTIISIVKHVSLFVCLPASISIYLSFKIRDLSSNMITSLPDSVWQLNKTYIPVSDNRRTDVQCIWYLQLPCKDVDLIPQLTNSRSNDVDSFSFHLFFFGKGGKMNHSHDGVNAVAKGKSETNLSNTFNYLVNFLTFLRRGRGNSFLFHLLIYSGICLQTWLPLCLIEFLPT